MNNEPMPSGCLSIEAAAQMLCITQNQLRKRLHQLHWLEKKHGHNTPTKLAIEGGFLKTQARGYPAPFNPKRTLTYYAAVVTQQGIEKLMQEHFQPETVQPAPVVNEKKPDEKPENFFTSKTDAHDQCMDLMRDWGLLDKAG